MGVGSPHRSPMVGPGPSAFLSPPGPQIRSKVAHDRASSSCASEQSVPHSGARRVRKQIWKGSELQCVLRAPLLNLKLG